MRQAERMIEVYHGTALVCAGLALAFLILAAVMFFVFRIPRTVAFLSGRREGGCDDCVFKGEEKQKPCLWSRRNSVGILDALGWGASGSRDAEDSDAGS